MLLKRPIGAVAAVAKGRLTVELAFDLLSSAAGALASPTFATVGLLFGFLFRGLWALVLVESGELVLRNGWSTSSCASLAARSSLRRACLLTYPHSLNEVR